MWTIRRDGLRSVPSLSSSPALTRHDMRGTTGTSRGYQDSNPSKTDLEFVWLNQRLPPRTKKAALVGRLRHPQDSVFSWLCLSHLQILGLVWEGGCAGDGRD